MHKTWTFLSVAALLSCSSLAQADLVAVKGSVDYWYTEGDANMAPQSQSDLSLDQKGSAQVTLAIEHPVPLLPNVKLRYSKIDNQTEQQIANTPVYDIQMENADYILYYELLDNVVSADLGIAAKQINADITVNGLTQSKIDETYPMLYGSVTAKLPFTGWSVSSETLLTDYDDTRISDTQAEIKYNFVDNLLVDLGAKVGYRALDIEMDKNSNNERKFEFKGPYIGLDAHF